MELRSARLYQAGLTDVHYALYQGNTLYRGPYANGDIDSRGHTVVIRNTVNELAVATKRYETPDCDYDPTSFVGRIVWYSPSLPVNYAEEDIVPTLDPLTHLPTDYAVGEIGHLIGDIKAKTDLITVGSVQIVQNGQNNIAGNRTLLRISERYILNFFGLGPIGSSEQMWFTIKSQLTDSDNSALVYIKRTGGLIRINGQAAGTSGHGSITVTNATTGDGTITLSELETINLAPSNLMPVYEIKVLDPTLGPQARIQGECSIVWDVNRQTS